MDHSLRQINSKTLPRHQFDHITSNPGYPQSNGKAESAVKTTKHIMEKAKIIGSDPWLSLLDHRNTPTTGTQTSPAQRLMSRRTRTLLPTTANLLKPPIPVDVLQELATRQAKQAHYYTKNRKGSASPTTWSSCPHTTTQRLRPQVETSNRSETNKHPIL